MSKDFKQEVKDVFDVKNEPLVVVIKGHYLIDRVLNAMLGRLLPKSSYLDLKRLSFILKFDFLSSSHVVPGELRPLADVVNTIRNKFAHDPYFEFSDREIARIKSKLRNIDLQVFPDSFYSEDDYRQVIVTAFAAPYINLSINFDRLIVRQVESLVSARMANEALNGGRSGRESGLSVHEEFQVRVRALLESDIDYGGKSYGALE
jgi:hypothetical protein